MTFGRWAVAMLVLSFLAAGIGLIPVLVALQ